jgi:integrase
VGAAGTAAEMLGFLVFIGCRTNEVLGAQWTEIDRALSTWRIPGTRMKMSQDHVVPLSDPALAILDRMDSSNRHELIFNSDIRFNLNRVAHHVNGSSRAENRGLASNGKG